jgi:sec-independent protein translocase protein TatA
MFGLGWGEILLILLIALIFLGPNKLPDLAKSLGKGIREFRKATAGLEDDIKKEVVSTGKEVVSEVKKAKDEIEKKENEKEKKEEQTEKSDPNNYTK